MDSLEIDDQGISPVEKARQKLRDAIVLHEREIVQRKEDIIRVKRNLNRLSPVSRLVPELFDVVFTYVAHDNPPYLPLYSWIRNITHICHEWRKIALQAPRVWNHLRLTENRNLMREIVARSKEAPLHVMTNDPLRNMWHLALIVRQLHRIHTMKLTLSHAMADPQIPSPFHAPELRHLELRAHSDWRTSSSLFFEDCDMPKLTHLELLSEKFRVPWSSSIFQRSLTHVVLMHRVPSASTLKSTLKALAGMPYLRSVSLIRVIPTQLEGASLVVHLGHLESLHLVDACSSCIALLQHISYPSTAALQLEISSFSDDELASLGGEITAKLSSADLDGVCIRSLAMKATADWPSRITAWRVAICADKIGTKMQCSDYPDLIFDLTLLCPNIIQPDLSRFRSPLPLSNVETLYLHAEGSSLESSWTELSDIMPNVKDLVISSDGLSDQSIAHLLTIDPTPDESASLPLFPSVNVLMLLGFKFRPDSSRYTASGTRSDLRKMLVSRKLAGRMIQTLCIDNAVNLYDDDLTGIRKEVKTLAVYWNNVSWDS